LDVIIFLPQQSLTTWFVSHTQCSIDKKIILAKNTIYSKVLLHNPLPHHLRFQNVPESLAEKKKNSFKAVKKKKMA